jgi:hypothetical protein
MINQRSTTIKSGHLPTAPRVSDMDLATTFAAKQ